MAPTWQYLGANVRFKPMTTRRALPETWIKDFGGVKVGFVGAVTEHLPELVSPAGIAGLRSRSPLSSPPTRGRRAQGRRCRHRRPARARGCRGTTAPSIGDDPSTDFGKIVNGVNDNVDAIVSGHTHLDYNRSFTVPGWVAEGRPVTKRPVVSAGQYGTASTSCCSRSTDTDEVVGQPAEHAAAEWPTPAGNYPTDSADRQAIVDEAVADAAVLGALPLGQIAGPFNRAKFSDGTPRTGWRVDPGQPRRRGAAMATESPDPGSAQIAFMNPGGLRADMVGSTAPDLPDAR